ncbi:MAG: thioredoxin family protein [Thermodesulfobacteriota bacterium]
MEMAVDVKILGPGCKKCIEMAQLVQRVIEENRIPARIEHISDIDKIAEYRVTNTPALAIGGDVKCAGRVPSPSEIRGWLEKIAGEP